MLVLWLVAVVCVYYPGAGGFWAAPAALCVCARAYTRESLGWEAHCGKLLVPLVLRGWCVVWVAGCCCACTSLAVLLLPPNGLGDTTTSSTTFKAKHCWVLLGSDSTSTMWRLFSSLFSWLVACGWLHVVVVLLRMV
jgi:hypothetical protein